MNQERFLSELKKKLRKLPKDEIDNILLYYKEYFEDSEKSEEEVIKELGSPSSVASQLLAEYAFDNTKQSHEKGFTAIFIILAILAAPIGIPFAIAAIVLLFAAIMVIGAILISFAAVIFAFFAAGVTVCIGGAAVILKGPATAIFYIGAGLIIIGLSILLAYAIKKILPRVYSYIHNICMHLIYKFNRKNKM
ncbi:MAG: DUF1700 domain-containing protein [Clostridium sp.]